METSFRLLRDLLNVRTVLTPAQFFEQGFAERKVLLLCDVITVCKKLHNDEVRHERLAALKATRQVSGLSWAWLPLRCSLPAREHAQCKPLPSTAPGLNTSINVSCVTAARSQEQVISRLATPHGGQQEPPSGGRHAAGRRSPVVKVGGNFLVAQRR